MHSKLLSLLYQYALSLIKKRAFRLSIRYSDIYAIILGEHPELAADNNVVTRRKLLRRGNCTPTT